MSESQEAVNGGNFVVSFTVTYTHRPVHLDAPSKWVAQSVLKLLRVQVIGQFFQTYHIIISSESEQRYLSDREYPRRVSRIILQWTLEKLEQVTDELKSG